MASDAGTEEQKPSEAGPVPRKTQRAPVSCAYCAKRKVKCDKTFPCKRCVEKGIADKCKREIVVVKGKVVGGENDDVPKRQYSLEDYEAENKALKKLVKKLTGQAVAEDLLGQLDVTPPSAPFPTPPISSSAGTALYSPPSVEKVRLAVEHHDMLSTDLTTVGMEDPATAMADGEKPTKRTREASPDISYLVPFAPGVTRSSRLRYLLSLVPLGQSRDLVTLCLRLTGWIHGVLHTPTFLEEHDRFVDDIRQGKLGNIRYEWLSVYFAVLSSGCYFLGDAWDRSQVFSPQQRLDLPRAWFSASLESLYLSELLTRHTLCAVQSICIYTLCAFSFGASGHLISLLHLGLRIAQTLGLHVLVAEPENEIPAPGLIKREIGRAIWGALSLGDALSPASQQPHALFIPEGISVPQSNLLPGDLVEGLPLRPQPLSTFTHSCTHIFLNYAGRIFRRFNREFWAASSLEAQYSLVEAADAELLALVAKFPQLHRSDEPYPIFIDLDHGDIPWQRWHQHHFAINLPRLRMSLHRCFLRKSYQDPKFLKSRQICLDAARQILQERQRVVPALFDRAWHITSDTVAAGVILCAVFGQERDLRERRALHGQVQQLIAVLAKGGPADNNLVQVGINLLTSYLVSPPPSPPTAAPPVHTAAAMAPALHPPVDPTYSIPSIPSTSNLPFDSYLAVAGPTAHPPAPTPGAPQEQLAVPDISEWNPPDLWSSLEMAGGGGAFDPFGGWEGAASLEWNSWTVGDNPAPAEYDPSRPSF
ncbi:hypothetical protein JCM10207_009073 [Rhodosporidiobolus poonsookiae]